MIDMMGRRPKLVLCDLDGTMVDSVPDLGHAVDEAMAQLGLPRRGEAQVRQWVGNGVERLLKRALLNQMDGEPDNTLLQEALALFKSVYAQCNGQHSRLYPHVTESLHWLQTQGFSLACITNKPEQFTLPLLRDLGIFDYFRLIVSGDTLPQRKPDPLPLRYAAEFFKVAPEEALMIGDSINDVQAARAAHFQIICVSYGYNHGEDIHTAHPDAVIDSFAELLNLLS